MNKKKTKGLYRVTKPLIAVVPVLAVFFSSGCRQKDPVIYSVDPKIGNLGEPLTVFGANFGNERGESFVTIAGEQPTLSSYTDWQDEKIVVRVPEFGESGLVYVHVNGKKSNGALFANRLRLPRQTEEGRTGLGPKITAIKPQNGAVGSLLEISGAGFGSSRGKGGVFFSWNAEMPVSAPAEAMVFEFIEVSEADFGYEFWSEREIQVRVPDGAADGNIEIRTAKGASLPLFFTVADKPGTKVFRDKRMYIFDTSVNIITGEAKTPNSLFLWVPRPELSASQRNIEIISSNLPPFMEDHRGTVMYKLEDLAANSDAQVNITWKVEVYRVETSVRPQLIRQDPGSPVGGAFTQGDPLIPSDDPRIKNKAAQITGRERNPYLKAQNIYQWMLKELIVTEERIDTDIFTALQTGRADSYHAALLYCALLRSAGVPSLPVAGVVVNRNIQTINHYWVEFWVDGFGWIPADPAMGAGAVPSPINPDREKETFYFGNIDSQRIAFSRNFAGLHPMTPGGRTVSLERSYALQSLWEEAAGGLDSYTSLWGDVIITGIYAQ